MSPSVFSVWAVPRGGTAPRWEFCGEDLAPDGDPQPESAKLFGKELTSYLGKDLGVELTRALAFYEILIKGGGGGAQEIIARGALAGQKAGQIRFRRARGEGDVLEFSIGFPWLGGGRSQDEK